MDDDITVFDDNFDDGTPSVSLLNGDFCSETTED